MKKRYDSYKPSGIDWIGDIPSHWTVCRIKDCFILKTGTTPKGFDKPINDNEINWFTPSDISSSGTILQEADRKLSENLINKEGISLFPQKSLIFVGIGATAGKLGFAEVAGYSNQQITGLIPKTCCSKYYFYYLCHDSKRVRDNASFTTLPIINNSYLSQVYWVMPPLAEQEAIAAWLDEKCEDIDAAIAKVDREIELIDELKQSEISRVVTRGLNPDAPLRPSGIDWIGNIPKHWKIEKGKYLLQILPGFPADSNLFVQDDDAFPLIRIRDIDSDTTEINYSGEVPENYIITKGDILVGMDGDFNIAQWKGPNALLNQRVCKISGTNKVLGKYAFYVLPKLLKRINDVTYATTVKHLSTYDILNSKLPVPLYSEQQAIADYLDAKCAEIDGLKAKLTKKRETLTELRQSIISEVVTGKRKII